jgi:uncharacterized protein involved in outer membrane biogenesis
LFGFFLAPRIIRAVVLWQLPKQIGRTVALREIKTNPFAMSLAIDGFAVAETDGKPFVTWDEVYVNADPTGLLHGELVVSQVTISNAFAHVQANRDGTFNFTDILQRLPSQPAPAKKSAGKPMTVRVGQLRITGTQLVYDDLTRSAPFHTTIGPIDVTLNDFSTGPDSRNPYGFDAVTESGERFSWKGVFNFAPIRSEGDFSIEGIKLGKYAPYYDDFVSLSIHDGRLDLRAHYRVEFTDRLTVAQASNLTVHVAGLKVGPAKSETNLVEVPDLRLGDTFIDLPGQIVNVGTFITRGARYEVERLKDGSINLVNLLTPPPRTSPPARQAATPSTNAPPAWVATVRDIAIEDWGYHVTGFLGEQRLHWDALRFANIVAHANPLSLSVDSIVLEQPTIDVVIPAEMTNAFARVASIQKTNAAAAPPAAKQPLPPVSIGSILVTNTAFAYQDDSLTPPATLHVSQLDVSVTGLSTEPNSRADLRVAGRIGNRGTIGIGGRINPLSIDAATEVQAALHDMNLVPLGSYAGKYAGYDVRSGQLSVEVKYTIEKRKLNAQNSVDVDRFLFGDATGSPEAVKLPVKLAVAILKDVNGQIKLDVPVEGRIDDPKFRYWGAVWHVLGGLFTKIFTAPFSMLGSMFGGGGEELGWQEFAPGSATLMPDQTKKLDVLIKAMKARPALAVEITGNVDKDKDLEPLQRRKLHEIVAQRAGTTNDYVALLRVLYAEALPQIQTKLAPPPPPTNFATNIENLLPPGVERAQPATPLTGSQAKKVASQLTEAEMERGYCLILQLTTDDYRRLAMERAESVRRYLLATGHLAPDRVYVTDLSKRPVPSAGTRAVFTLE